MTRTASLAAGRFAFADGAGTQRSGASQLLPSACPSIVAPALGWPTVVKSAPGLKGCTGSLVRRAVAGEAADQALGGLAR